MNFPKLHYQAYQRPGFTVVELLIVIVVIGVLATVTGFVYRGLQQKTKLSLMSSSLRSAAEAFELYKYDTGNYPTDMPTNIKVSKGVVLSATNTGDDTFCINAYYSSDATLRISWNSETKGIENHLCTGMTVGTASGGSIPAAPKGINLMPAFSEWTLNGTASYNAITGELTFGASGSASSPLVRVDQPTGIKTGGDMYATVASANGTLAPQGGYHVSINYYAADGVTPALNSGGFTSNGCAKAIPLNSWQINVQTCSFSGGPNVIYASYTFQGPSGGYTSSDLKIKNPLLITN